MNADTGGCPHCGAPYRKTVSADEDTLGELALPEEEYETVCYNVRTYPEAYLGFTLYFHPGTVYAVETRRDEAAIEADTRERRPDSGEAAWRRADGDVYASMATARSRRKRLERASGTETRIRELPLAAARRLPEDRPRDPQP